MHRRLYDDFEICSGGQSQAKGYMWENSIQSAYELNVAQEYQLYNCNCK